MTSLRKNCFLILLVLALNTIAASPTWADPQICGANTYGVNPGSVNSSAFDTLLAACAGRTIQFAAGTYIFQPNGDEVGFYIAGGTPESPTKLVGSGASGTNNTIFKIANTGTYQSLLWIRNSSNVFIQDIRFEGTAYSSGCTSSDYGHAIYVRSDMNAASSVENLEISDNTFFNFNGQYWLALEAPDQSPGIGTGSEILVTRNTFDASTPFDGGCASTSHNTYPVFMISIAGSTVSPQRTVSNVSVASNTFLANYVKGALAIWSGTSRTSVQYNTISNAGVQISHNAISGQHDSFDGEEPKAAVALNRGVNIEMYNNDLADNFAGVEVAGGTVTSTADSITVPKQGVGMKVVMDSTSTIHVDGLTIVTAFPEGTPSSIVGIGYPTNCSPSCAQSSFKNISQIGWGDSSSLPRSLSWYSSGGSQTYHSYADVRNVAFAGISRQASAQTPPKAQSVFWPYLN